MNLHVVNVGTLKLDGGAMFGVVPKSIWQRTNPADENNLCTWAMRCLLVESGDRLLLIDNGMGDKQSDRFLSFYHPTGEGIVKAVEKSGFNADEVTDMFLTHLHFDHCGGGVTYSDSEKTIPALTFKNAKYWSNEAHWQWATQPNPREKASFLKENLLPMQESGNLEFVTDSNQKNLPFEVLLMDGHTEKQMLPKIKYKDHTLVFAADLLPSVGHIPLPYVMGYDVRPLITIKEKAEFLEEAVDNNYILFFEHDPVNECCTLKRTEKGVRVDQIFPLSDLG